MPNIAKFWLEDQEIGKKAMEDFTNSSLTEKSVGFLNPIKRSKHSK